MKNRSKDLDPSEIEFLRSAGATFERWVAAHAGCPPPELLRAAHAGALPEEMNDQVNAHTRGCATCRQLQADFETHEYLELSPAETDRLYARIRAEASGEQAKAARAGRHFFFRPAVVMGALAVLAVVVLFRMDHSTKVEAPVPQGAQTAPPTFALPRVKPEVKLTAAALVFRGGNQAGFVKDIAPALDAYRADQFAQAAGMLAPLAKKYPQSVEVWFYLGVSRLLNDDAAGAVEALEAAAQLKEESFEEDVAWYLSVAHERAGRPGDALPLLRNLCSGKGAHQTEACAGAERLDKHSIGKSSSPRR